MTSIFRGHVNQLRHLTLKAPNKNCSRQHFNFLLLSFEENKGLIFQRIHLKHQVLFSLKNNEKILVNVICCVSDSLSAAVMIGALRVKNEKRRMQNIIASYMLQGKNIWKMKFFPGQGKVREFFGWSGKFRKDLESQEKVREFENKWLWWSDFRKFIFSVGGKDVHTFSRDSRSPSPSS